MIVQRVEKHFILNQAEYPTSIGGGMNAIFYYKCILISKSMI